MTTLSEYNNNPGNLRPPKGVTYEGQIGVDDKGFAVFQNKEFGQKALINDVTHKLETGINTPEKFVDRFAPSGTENSEDARDNYKLYLAQQLGLKSTNEPFPKDAASRLAHAVGAFEGGTWATPSTKPSESTGTAPDPSDQYSGKTVDTKQSQEEMNRSALEAGAMGAALGAGAGSIYTAKAPAVRLAQRVGLLPGGKPISPSDAANLVEKTMTANAPVESVVRKPHGGENWQKSLTGISTPGAQMDKSSLDLAKRMQQAVSIAGEPGFTGGTITEGGIILNPQEAAAVKAKQEMAAVRAAENEAKFQQMLQKAGQPDYIQRGARTIMGSAPVRGAAAGLGMGYNIQDAYNQFDQGNTLGGSLATGAAGASALGLIPRLAPVMNPAAIGLTTAAQMAADIKRGDRQAAAESGLTGLTALAPRFFGPISAGVYSRGLNEGEKEELSRRRMLPPTITP